jgi:hypothetical protein
VGLYVYAFVDRVPPRLPARGISGEGLTAVRCGRVAAIVGRRRAPPPVEVGLLRRQQRILLRLSDVAPALLPARFGSFVSDARALRDRVANRHERLIGALALVRGREQMTLRLIGGTQAPAHFGRRGPAGTGLHQRRSRAGTRYLKQRRRDLRGVDVGALRPIRRAVGRIVIAERIARGDTALVVTVYHLVPRGRADRYRALIERARSSIETHGVRLVVTGPWPAFAFAPEEP